MSVSRETIWKKIIDINYEVSNRGEIRHIKKKTIIKLMPKGIGRNDYLYFKVWNTRLKKNKSLYVHRVVLLAFDPEHSENKEAMHIEPNRYDNRYPENLKWGTRKENMEELKNRLCS